MSKLHFGTCDCCEARNVVLHKRLAPGGIETAACASCCGLDPSDDADELRDEIDRLERRAESGEQFAHLCSLYQALARIESAEKRAQSRDDLEGLLKSRIAHHVACAAALLGCAPEALFDIHPTRRESIADRARSDVSDMLTGNFPLDGLTDVERLSWARTRREADSQPITEHGNREHGHLLAEADRIRRIGLARVRERRLGVLRGEVLEAAE